MLDGMQCAVWERQAGRCHHCGCELLVDQPKVTVRIDPRGGDGPGNSAYVHESCLFDEVEELMVDTQAGLGRWDALGPLEDIERELHGEMRPLPEDWPYMPLKEWFAGQTAASVTLTFAQIERKLGFKLPPSAHERPRWWRKEGWLLINRAWETEGYELARLSVKDETARFSRAEVGMAHLKVPEKLTRGRLPDNAVFELERFFEYVIGKYGL